MMHVFFVSRIKDKNTYEPIEAFFYKIGADYSNSINFPNMTHHACRRRRRLTWSFIRRLLLRGPINHLTPLFDSALFQSSAPILSKTASIGSYAFLPAHAQMTLS